MAVRPQDLVFYAGGECLADYGVLVKRTSPGEEIVETFDRNSNQYFVDPNGVLKVAATDVPAVEWLDLDGDGVFETPVLLLEGERENGWTYSEELDQGVYTKTRCSISADATTAPDGESTADKVVEDGTAASTHYVYRETSALSNDTDQPLSLFAKVAERTEIRIHTRNKANDAWNTWIDLSDGSIGTSDANHTVRVTPLGDDWYKIEVVWDSGSGATTPYVQINLGSGSETITYDGDGSSGLYLWGIQFEVDKPFASSYMKTGAATYTRIATQFSCPYPFPPQKMDIYVKFRERGTIGVNNLRVFQISDAAGNDAKLYIASNGTSYDGVHDPGAASVSTLVAAPSIDDTVELRLTLSAAGVAQIHQSIDAAAESSASAGAVRALTTAWSGPLLYINSGGTGNIGSAAFDAVKVVLDPEGRDYTLDELRDVS